MNNDTPDSIRFQITQGQTAIVSKVDIDLSWIEWHAQFDNRYPDGGKFKVRRNTLKPNGKRGYVFIHQLILARMLGRELMKGEKVDHINGDPLDNRRDNLRLTTHADNCKNRHRQVNNTSGYKGVSSQRRVNGVKWTAYITSDKKRYHLGCFETPEEAYAAYCEAAIRLHGEFARLE